MSKPTNQSKAIPLRMPERMIQATDKAARQDGEGQTRAGVMRSALETELRRRGLWPPTVEGER